MGLAMPPFADRRADRPALITTLYHVPRGLREIIEGRCLHAYASHFSSAASWDKRVNQFACDIDNAKVNQLTGAGEDNKQRDLNVAHLLVMAVAKLASFFEDHSINVPSSASGSPDINITHAKQYFRSGDVSSGDLFARKQCHKLPVFGKWVSSGRAAGPL